MIHILWYVMRNKALSSIVSAAGHALMSLVPNSLTHAFSCFIIKVIISWLLVRLKNLSWFKREIIYSRRYPLSLFCVSRTQSFLMCSQVSFVCGCLVFRHMLRWELLTVFVHNFLLKLFLRFVLCRAVVAQTFSPSTCQRQVDPWVRGQPGPGWSALHRKILSQQTQGKKEMVLFLIPCTYNCVSVCMCQFLWVCMSVCVYVCVYLCVSIFTGAQVHSDAKRRWQITWIRSYR